MNAITAALIVRNLLKKKLEMTKLRTGKETIRTRRKGKRRLKLKSIAMMNATLRHAFANVSVEVSILKAKNW